MEEHASDLTARSGYCHSVEAGVFDSTIALFAGGAITSHSSLLLEIDLARCFVLHFLVDTMCKKG